MQNPVYYDNRYYLYKLFISSDNGISFRLVKIVMIFHHSKLMGQFCLEMVEIQKNICWLDGPTRKRALPGQTDTRVFWVLNWKSRFRPKSKIHPNTQKQRVNVTVNGILLVMDLDKPGSGEKYHYSHDVLKEGVQRYCSLPPDANHPRVLDYQMTAGYWG